jgi:hypothetical protein
MKEGFKIQFVCCFLFCALAVSYVCYEKCFRASRGASIFCDRTTIELVGVSDHDSIDVEFVIQNVGRQPLLISDVRVGCAKCIEVGPFDKSPIPKGHSSVLQARLLPASIASKQTKVITVLSNDPFNPRYALKIVITP